MDIFEFKELLSECWNKDTCSPGLKDKWSEDNPSLGQCAITALIVNDYFGGKIMRCMSSSGSHYYNLIDDKIFDLTVEQFLGEIPLYEEGKERTREYLLSNNDTKNRYKKLLYNLKYRIESNLDNRQSELMCEDAKKLLIKLYSRKTMDKYLKKMK